MQGQQARSSSSPFRVADEGYDGGPGADEHLRPGGRAYRMAARTLRDATGSRRQERKRSGSPQEGTND
jgi:hypothetical protein